jgi:hypothetical protein
LRLLFVIHLHDRHGAHLTLEEALKQAGQSSRTSPRRGHAEAFSYNRENLPLQPARKAFFVINSLQRVKQTFHQGCLQTLTTN